MTCLNFLANDLTNSREQREEYVRLFVIFWPQVSEMIEMIRPLGRLLKKRKEKKGGGSCLL